MSEQQYLNNIQKGRTQLETEQHDLATLRSRDAEARLRARALGEPVPAVSEKSQDVLEAEARVRACKKYIENNIIALGYAMFYPKSEIIYALRDWALHSSERASSDRTLSRADLSSALAQLPERQYKCVILHYAEGRAVADIARLLQITRYFVKKETSAGVVNLSVALNGPLLRRLEMKYANYMIQNSLDLLDLYMTVSADSQEVLSFAYTAQEWANAVALPTEGEPILSTQTDEEEEAA